MFWESCIIDPYVAIISIYHRVFFNSYLFSLHFLSYFLSFSFFVLQFFDATRLKVDTDRFYGLPLIGKGLKGACATRCVYINQAYHIIQSLPGESSWSAIIQQTAKQCSKHHSCSCRLQPSSLARDYGCRSRYICSRISIQILFGRPNKQQYAEQRTVGY